MWCLGWFLPILGDMMKLRIFYTLNGRDGSTDIECNGPDTEAAREKFRRSFPGIVIRKAKVIRQ